MAGSKNDTHYSSGYNLLPTNASAISLMQLESTGIQLINVSGNPEGVIASNPGSVAHDRTNGALYLKVSGTGSTGWQQVPSGGDIAESFVTDSGTAIPSSGILNVLGSGSITTTGSGNTSTTSLTGLTNHSVLVGAGTSTITKLAVGTNGQLLIGSTAADPAFATPTINANGNLALGASSLAINPYNCAKLIVDSTANIGTHQTIAAAITAASTGETIFIRPGTYTENLTLKAGVNLTAFGSDSSANATGKVIINGTCTLTTAGSVTISGIQLQTNSAELLSVTGSAASIVNLQNCYLNCSNNTGITFSTSSSSGKINLVNCFGNIGTTGISLFTHSSAGTLTIQNCNIANSGASTTASTISAGTANIVGGMLNIPITSSSTATLGITNSNIDTSATNTTTLTCGGSGSQGVYNSFISSGTASAISVSSTVGVYNSVLNSSNSSVVTGAGTIQYAGITQGTGTGTISASTNTGEPLAAGSITFDGGTTRLGTYAEGTFTPTMVGTVAGTTTYSAQNGYYRRIGNLVQLQAVVSGTAATGTGTMILGAFPFTVKNQTNGTSFGSIISPNAGWAWPVGSTDITMDALANTTTGNVYCSGTATAGGNLQMTNAVFSFQYTIMHQV